MFREFLVILLIVFPVASQVSADDLYRVVLGSQADAGILAESGADLIHRSRNEYLVLAAPETADQLRQAGLSVDQLTPNVSRGQLAVDGRLDRANVGLFPLVYEKDNFRLYRIDPISLAASPERPELFPVPTYSPAVKYLDPSVAAFDYSQLSHLDRDLDSLISRISVDSLESYDLRLQAFYRRLAGTDSANAARDWIVAKLQSFGYDSIVVDSFQAILNGTTKNCQNVLAYKTGTTYPGHQIVVGAHRDAVDVSPGADDNGSGTAGVLEFARVLKDIPTDMTFVFALYDAEEFGLYGSWKHANEAAYRGDSIVYMFNMDMLGFYDNTNVATLYYGDDPTFSVLWQHLADSLLGVTGVLSGESGGSDHYPFTQNGYDVTFVIEYEFSSVYHTARDSSTYMNFDYMTKLVKAGLATCYVINATEIPAPALTFQYPAGVPDVLAPGEAAPLQVQVNGAFGGSIVPGTVTLWYSVDGAGFNPYPMLELAPGLYQAEFAESGCNSVITYYVSADELSAGTFYDPQPDNPRTAFVSTSQTAVFEDDFQTNKGWLATYAGATSGLWQRGVPIDDGGWPYDPIADGDGSGMCWVTGNSRGNTDVDGGAVRLTSPVFDLSAGGAISYDYYLFLTDDFGGVDALTCEIEVPSLGTWVEIARHDAHGGIWWHHGLITEAEMLAAGVVFQPNMRVRFIAGDADPQSIVEAGVDGFKVIHYDCEPPSCCGAFTGGYTGNTNCDIDGKRNLSDVTRLIDVVYISQSPLCCEADGNTNGDLENKVNLSDITRLIDFVYISHTEVAQCL